MPIMMRREIFSADILIRLQRKKTYLKNIRKTMYQKISTKSRIARLQRSHIVLKEGKNLKTKVIIAAKSHSDHNTNPPYWTVVGMETQTRFQSTTEKAQGLQNSLNLQKRYFEPIVK